MAIENQGTRCYGLQYHPEVRHSDQGMATLKHFLFGIAQLKADWKLENILDEELEKLRRQVKLHPVTTLMLLSSHVATDLLLLSKHSVTDLLSLSDRFVTDLLLLSNCSVTDLLLLSKCFVTDLLLLSKCSVTDLLLLSKYSVTDLLLLSSTGKLRLLTKLSIKAYTAWHTLHGIHCMAYTAWHMEGLGLVLTSLLRMFGNVICRYLNIIANVCPLMIKLDPCVDRQHCRIRRQGAVPRQACSVVRIAPCAIHTFVLATYAPSHSKSSIVPVLTSRAILYSMTLVNSCCGGPSTQLDLRRYHGKTVSTMPAGGT